MEKGNILTYKGYYTKIEYDSELKIMSGIIEDINDLIYFESTNSETIIEEFHKSVDDYLAFCSANNIEPDKAYKGTFNVRIDTDLHKKLSQFAFVNGKSLNSIVEDSIRYYITYRPQDIINQVKESISNTLLEVSNNDTNVLKTWKGFKSDIPLHGSSSSTCVQN